MTRLERLIEAWGLTASALMVSVSWWRRALGLVLACVAMWCLVALMAVWVLIGRAAALPMMCPRCLAEHGVEFPGTPLSFDVTISTHAHTGTDGTEHRYEPNTSVTRYRCVLGHEWTHAERQSCWCGWGATCV